MNIGQAILRRRKSASITLAALEELSGVNRKNLSEIERGLRGVTLGGPRGEVLESIADALGCHVWEIVKEGETE